MTTAPSRSRIFRDRLPPAGAGQRIGLLGGSFDPAHAGHRAISLAALSRLKLDAVWWLVSPGNPLKPDPSADLDHRLANAAAIADHPRIAITGAESAFGTRYSVDTLRVILRRCRDTSFVWLIGADSLATFHLWRDWRRIAVSLPLAIIDRPGWTHRAVASPAARFLARYRIPESAAAMLAVSPLPAWAFLHGPRNPLSSTALRSARRSKIPS